ncbi:MAG: TylF/MycF/NovP-related O-methyltransferase [Hoeflea sp.]|uniref:TylF/MycF/NovP-related O-methyltransferase n=1 Tax=Hoeflea sp. TaxID=1940281 RepID=UPI003EF30074
MHGMLPTVTFNTSIVDPFHPDERWQRIYNESIVAAQEGRHDNIHKRMRFFILCQLVDRAVKEMPLLDLAECGCFLGHSTQMIARIIQENGGGNSLRVFDSFDGLSEFQSQDESDFCGTQESKDRIRSHFKSDFDAVQAHLKPFDFVELFRGWIPDEFYKVADRQFSFVSIDVDLYRPVLDSLEFFYPRLAKGGYVYLDDYGYQDFPGARKAVDQYFSDKSPSFFLRMPFGSAVVIK